MVNVEQAIRLQAAGLPVENGFQEMEIMEWLKDWLEKIYYDGNKWHVEIYRFEERDLSHSNLAEALVQAVEAVNAAGKEKKCQKK